MPTFVPISDVIRSTWASADVATTETSAASLPGFSATPCTSTPGFPNPFTISDVRSRVEAEDPAVNTTTSHS